MTNQPTLRAESIVSKFYQRKEQTGHTIIEAEKASLILEIEKELAQAIQEAVEARLKTHSDFIRREFIHYISDPECFHGMFFDNCQADQCETRAENHVVSKLFEVLSQAEGVVPQKEEV